GGVRARHPAADAAVDVVGRAPGPAPATPRLAPRGGRAGPAGGRADHRLAVADAGTGRARLAGRTGLPAADGLAARQARRAGGDRDGALDQDRARRWTGGAGSPPCARRASSSGCRISIRRPVTAITPSSCSRVKPRLTVSSARPR